MKNRFWSVAGDRLGHVITTPKVAVHGGPKQYGITGSGLPEHVSITLHPYMVAVQKRKSVIHELVFGLRPRTGSKALKIDLVGDLAINRKDGIGRFRVDLAISQYNISILIHAEMKRLALAIEQGIYQQLGWTMEGKISPDLIDTTGPEE